jgi:hypothetical protein
MRNTPKSLNEELNRMKRLMSFEVDENSHDVLSENFVNEQQTRIGSQRKNITIGWGKGKTITLKKGKEDGRKELSQGETKPTKPVDEWDGFLKGDKTMVRLMNTKSKGYWETLKNSDDIIEKGFAVAALEEFINTDGTSDWKKVNLGKETTEEEIPEEGDKDPGIEITFPLQGEPSSDFFKNNEWVPTDLLKQEVQEDIITPITQLTEGKKECEGEPIAFLQDITISTSASRFRNGITESWLELSKNRNDAALNYMTEQLKGIGVLIDGDTKITQNIKGGNGDGSSGPNPGKDAEGRQYAISPDGGSTSGNLLNKNNKAEWGKIIGDVPGKNKIPHKTDAEYEKYKYCNVQLNVVINICEKDFDTDDDITILEVDNYSIQFKSSQPGLKIKLPKFKAKWEKKKKKKNHRFKLYDCFKWGKKGGKKPKGRRKFKKWKKKKGGQYKKNPGK